MATLSLSAPARLSSSLLRSAMLLVDGGSADLQPLQHGGRLPLAVLEPGSDPLRQITCLLSQARQQQPIASLHLIAHGRPGAIRLLDRWLDRTALTAASSEIRQWNLETLVLWGCEVGADPLFVNVLAELSGARVLASHQVIAAATSHEPTEFGLSLADLYAPDVLRRWSGRLADIRLDGDLNFANGVKLTTSDFNPAFTTYLFRDAYVSADGRDKVDAMVTLTGITNGRVVDFDSPNLQYNEPDWFQPVISVFGSRINPSAIGAEAKFLFTFIEPGSVSDLLRIDNSALSVSSTNPNQLLLNGSSSWYSTVTLSEVVWNSYDIDGYTLFGQPTTARQFVGSTDFVPGKIETFFSPYNPADPTNPPDQSRVAITYPTPSTFRATSTIGFDVTDPPGTVDFLRQSVSVGLKPLSSFTATLGDSGWYGDIIYQAFFSLDFTKGIDPTPEIVFAKSVVGPSQVAPFAPVTYEYSVTSINGSFDGASLVISDDNATPTFKPDDFGYDAASTSTNQVIKPVLQNASIYNIGDLNNNGNVDSGEAWKFRATVIPPLPMQVQTSSTAPKQDSGIVSWTTLANGDIRVFYRQNQAFNDNTYGTGSDAGWTKQGKTHTFNNLVGSDKAGFVVYYADGSEMARFYQDYISASGTATADYSGYQSLGFSGGDGSWESGTTQSAFTDFDSTLELNLNRSGGFTLNTASGGFTPYTKMIVNTPTAAAALPPGGIEDPNWDQINGYFFTIKQSALAAKGFGGAFIFDQHNSPAKVGGSNSYVPTVLEGDSTNTATFAIKSLVDQQIYTDTDQATVTVGNNVPPPPPGQMPKFFVVDDKSPDSTYTYAASGAAIGSWLLKEKYNKYSRDIASNADGSNLWVLDKSKAVNLYSKDVSGKYVWQSAWKAYSLSKEPEGLSYDNFNNTNAIWAANRDGAVQWYNGGGSAADNSKLKTDVRFSVKPVEKNADLKGIVTDGNNTIWVLFDNKDGKNDTIQRYTISRGTVNGVANTPTGLTLVNTLSLGTKLGSVTGVTLDSTQGANGDLWIVSAGEGSKGKDAGIYALAGARGITTNSTLTPTLVGALAPGNTRPQGIADPFVPDAPDLTAAPAASAPDPIIAPAPAPPVPSAPSAPPAPLLVPAVVPPVASAASLPLIAPPLLPSPQIKGSKAFFTPAGLPGSDFSSLDMKAINMRTLMSMMTSASYFQYQNPALSI